MRLFINLFFVLFFSLSVDARIRNRKVKEAPKSCKLMDEDALLSRDRKKVYGTLRHSLIFEKTESGSSVSLVKDKGEKICEWTGEQWNQVLKKHSVENLMGFKYHIDEFKEVIYPYVRKSDGEYFLMSIPFYNCSLEDQATRIKLELPKCQIPKKIKKRRVVKKKK